jgi:hypothetical protein
VCVAPESFDAFLHDSTLFKTFIKSEDLVHMGTSDLALLKKKF